MDCSPVHAQQQARTVHGRKPRAKQGAYLKKQIVTALEATERLTRVAAELEGERALLQARFEACEHGIRLADDQLLQIVLAHIALGRQAKHLLHTSRRHLTSLQALPPSSKWREANLASWSVEQIRFTLWQAGSKAAMHLRALSSHSGDQAAIMSELNELAMIGGAFSCFQSRSNTARWCVTKMSNLETGEVGWPRDWCATVAKRLPLDILPSQSIGEMQADLATYHATVSHVCNQRRQLQLHLCQLLGQEASEQDAGNVMAGFQRLTSGQRMSNRPPASPGPECDVMCRAEELVEEINNTYAAQSNANVVLFSTLSCKYAVTPLMLSHMVAAGLPYFIDLAQVLEALCDRIQAATPCTAPPGWHP